MRALALLLAALPAMAQTELAVQCAYGEAQILEELEPERRDIFERGLVTVQSFEPPIRAGANQVVMMSKVMVGAPFQISLLYLAECRRDEALRAGCISVGSGDHLPMCSDAQISLTDLTKAVLAADPADRETALTGRGFEVHWHEMMPRGTTLTDHKVVACACEAFYGQEGAR